MKQRYLFSMLCAAALLYFALPRMDLAEQGLSLFFNILWILFALVVIGGNLTGLLYGKVQHRKQKTTAIQFKQKKVRHRQVNY